MAISHVISFFMNNSYHPFYLERPMGTIGIFSHFQSPFGDRLALLLHQLPSEGREELR